MMPQPRRRRRRSGVYVSDPLPIQVAEDEPEFGRADIEFHGVDHSETSFEGRVFINNSRANERTPLDAEHGYAGSFFIFGHGGCFGDVGHCDVPAGPLSAYDRRPPHQLTPQTKIVTVTDHLRALARTAGEELTVTVVPVVPQSIAGDSDTTESVLRFEYLTLVTYD